MVDKLSISGYPYKTYYEITVLFSGLSSLLYYQINAMNIIYYPNQYRYCKKISLKLTLNNEESRLTMV